jgi:hypothetical protein
VYNIKQAAVKVGISEGLLILWVSTGRFKPSGVASLKSTDFAKESIAARALASWTGAGEEALGWNRFHFDDDDIERLRKLVEQTASNKAKAETAHTKGSHYTVQEMAVIMGLGVDKIREIFEKEPDTIKLKNPAKKGKRAYTTLRIPESVAARVQAKLR